MKDNKRLSLDKKMEILEPDEPVLRSYKQLEAMSLIKANKGLTKDKMDLKAMNLLNQFMARVNKMRGIFRADMAIKAQIFRDISKDKTELALYIKATFPHMTKLVTK